MPASSPSSSSLSPISVSNSAMPSLSPSFSSFPAQWCASSSSSWSLLLVLLCCCYCLLSGAVEAAPLQPSGGASGEQFERADRDYRPLQFGKRESYRPLQFGKRTLARGPFGPSGVAPFAYGPASLHNMHNGGLEEIDPTMDQYVLVMERRK
ncbi:hypothetical protein niasHS_009761 [Heterodera schachtii]|uniref:Uncharacterized protein n=1 Tax=Heterodera schachtii TaxID=97005 RepID=A0ABD2J6S1_HETSC